MGVVSQRRLRLEPFFFVGGRWHGDLWRAAGAGVGWLKSRTGKSACATKDESGVKPPHSKVGGLGGGYEKLGRCQFF